MVRLMLGAAMQDRQLPIGVKRERNGNSLFKVDGQPVRSSADLAVYLPLLLINAHSFSLLEGPTKERRQFFDWLVFHVKPEFRSYWKDYARLMKQRNSLLRRDKIAYSDLHPWDKQIVELSEKISKARDECFAEFTQVLQHFIAESSLAGLGDWQIAYVKGWNDAEASLGGQLEEGFERDRRYGYTTLGPHKSNFRLGVNKQLASETLSRGQLKVLIVALYLSLAKVFHQYSGRSPVFLLDDLPSELDGAHIQRLGHWINEAGSQVFITGVSRSALQEFWPELDKQSEDISAFHVKHGEIELGNL